MIKQFIRLPNGNKKETYAYMIGSDESTIQFIEQDFTDIKNFFGTEIIDYLDILDENNKLLDSFNVYQKVLSYTYTTDTITEYEQRLIQDAYDETVTETDISGTVKEKTIHHDAIYQDIPKYRTADLILVKLTKPSIQEEVDNIKSVVGIVNTNNMTLDEFKSYYKEQIGKECTAAIENGVDVETTLGKKHFSYTIEDQSNVKDLIITAIFTDFTLPLPYHADGELCTLYQPNDIQKIYMFLCSNKTYHTTYCNVLNAMINEAKDLVSVKAITYGMEITDEKYLEVMSKINESKDALLTYVEKKFTLNKSNSENPKEESNNE